jgi:uncharacterized protein YjbI with pentapeptide repeats
MMCANLEGANLQGANFEDPAGTSANLEGAVHEFFCDKVFISLHDMYRVRHKSAVVMIENPECYMTS